MSRKPQCTAMADSEQCVREQHRSIGGWHRSATFTWPSERWRLIWRVHGAPSTWAYIGPNGFNDVRMLQIDDFSRRTK